MAKKKDTSVFYHCNNCGFEFEGTTKTSQCPDCGKAALRYASNEEELCAREMKKIVSQEKWEPAPQSFSCNVEKSVKTTLAMYKAKP